VVVVVVVVVLAVGDFLHFTFRVTVNIFWPKRGRDTRTKLTLRQLYALLCFCRHCTCVLLLLLFLLFFMCIFLCAGAGNMLFGFVYKMCLRSTTINVTLRINTRTHTHIRRRATHTRRNRSDTQRGNNVRADRARKYDCPKKRDQI